jgi:hypothetical protein
LRGTYGSQVGTGVATGFAGGCCSEFGVGVAVGVGVAIASVPCASAPAWLMSAHAMTPTISTDAVIATIFVPSLNNSNISTPVATQCDGSVMAMLKGRCLAMKQRPKFYFLLLISP